MDLIICLILTEMGNWIAGNVLHSDIFADAGLDYAELEFMDPDERREALEDAGLDSDEFDF